MSADDNLRDALIEAFIQADNETMDLFGPPLDELADIALNVVKDWAVGTKHTDSGIGSSRQAGAEMDKIHGFIREAVIEEIMECFDGTDSRRIFEEEASLIAAQVNRRVSQKIAGS